MRDLNKIPGCGEGKIWEGRLKKKYQIEGIWDTVKFIKEDKKNCTTKGQSKDLGKSKGDPKKQKNLHLNNVCNFFLELADIHNIKYKKLL